MHEPENLNNNEDLLSAGDAATSEDAAITGISSESVDKPEGWDAMAAANTAALAEKDNLISQLQQQLQASDTKSARVGSKDKTIADLQAQLADLQQQSQRVDRQMISANSNLYVVQPRRSITVGDDHLVAGDKTILSPSEGDRLVELGFAFGEVDTPLYRFGGLGAALSLPQAVFDEAYTEP
eukprot:gene18719-23664_t